MPDVIVIGGGIAGLACAVALADSGLQVVVLERSERLGGRAGSWTDATTGDTVDIGPHIVHSGYDNMLAFLERLGTRDLITWQPKRLLAIASKPRATVLRQSPLPAPLTLFPSLLTVPGLSMRDHLSMRATMLDGMKFGEEDVERLDRITALDVLREHGVSPRMMDWWWRFAAMVVTNVPLERCSAASLMRIHAQLSGHRGLHFGFAAVGLADLYAEQATRVIEAAGGRVIVRAEVVGIAGEDRAEGVVLADGARFEAKHCICAMPPQDLARAWPDRWRDVEPFAVLDQFEPSPYVSCYVWFDRVVTRERFFAHLWSPNRLNYDFYELTRIRHGWSERPSVIASNIIYSHRAHGMSDEDIVRATVQEIAEFAPHALKARVCHACVHRIAMAIPCPTPGFERRRPDVRTAIPGLLLAGDWVRTHLPCTMESAVFSGWRAAEEVLSDLGRPRRLALGQRPTDGIAGMVRRRRVRREQAAVTRSLQSA
jgi:squalene-associated FAD-dependent desaturase